MKLRNKKTGEIVELSIYGIEVHIRKEEQPFYHSLAELNEEWEDYEPKEPLIKDEKIRKCVKLWAEIQGIEGDNCVKISKYPDAIGIVSFDLRHTTNIILEGVRADERLEECRDYTINELCGEEE